MKRSLPLATAMVLALLVSGCAGDDSGSATEQSATSPAPAGAGTGAGTGSAPAPNSESGAGASAGSAATDGSAATAGSSGAAPAVDGNLTGSLVVWVDDTRTEPAKKWAAANPGVKVDVQTVSSDPGSTPTKIGLANNAGKGWPDVVFLGNPEEVAALAANPIAFAAPLDGSVDPAVLQGFAAGTIERCTFEGKPYCLPNDIAQTVLWYNKALMDRFGYQVPRTMDEYRALSEKVAKEHPGYVMGSVAGRYGLNAFFGSSGCPYSEATSQTEMRINTSDPKCARVTDVIGPMVANKTLSTLDPFDPAVVKIGNANKILMMPAPSWFGDFAFKPTYKTPKGELAAAQMPTWSGESKPWAGAVGGGLWVVSKHSENPDAANAFAVAMSTDPAIQGPAPTYPADKKSAEKWLASKKSDAYYAGDPGPVMQTEAGLINPVQSYIRFSTQQLDSFNKVVVPALGGGNAGQALQTFGDQLKQAAQASGYQVSGG